MKIVLVPLDERPVNTRYPQMIAEIAGAELVLPPVEIRGSGRTPADTGAVSDWLEKEAASADGTVASVEFLAWGNLINSRISNNSALESQALIEMKNNYCNERRCLDCAVGNAILKIPSWYKFF